MTPCEYVMWRYRGGMDKEMAKKDANTMTEEELKKKASTMTWKEASEEDRRIFKPIHDATQRAYEEFLEKQEIFVKQQKYRPENCIKRLCEDWIDMTEDDCNERVARMVRKQASEWSTNS
jgi:hypothetical protein